MPTNQIRAITPRAHVYRELGVRVASYRGLQVICQRTELENLKMSNQNWGDVIFDSSNWSVLNYNCAFADKGLANHGTQALWGRGNKEPGIYCLRMRLIIWHSKVFGFLRVRPCYVTSPAISRTLNFTLEKWIARFCTLLNASLCFCDFERRTNSLRQGHLWRKGRISLAAYRFWQVNVLWSTALRVWWQARKRDRTTSYWSSTKTTRERIHVELRSFTTICTYVRSATLPRRFVINVIVVPPIYVYVKIQIHVLFKS